MFANCVIQIAGAPHHSIHHNKPKLTSHAGVGPGVGGCGAAVGGLLTGPHSDDLAAKILSPEKRHLFGVDASHTGGHSLILVPAARHTASGWHDAKPLKLHQLHVVSASHAPHHLVSPQAARADTTSEPTTRKRKRNF
jgi:hypothetical protein